MKKDIRTRILSILVDPTTVTGIKEILKDVESFGTIAYHLKKLQDDGIIDNRKDTSKRGSPTTYFLVDKNLIEAMKEIRRDSIMGKMEVLKIVKDREFIEEGELTALLERSGIPEKDIGIVVDEIFGCSNEKLTTMHFKITPRGLRFLKGSKK